MSPNTAFILSCDVKPIGKFQRCMAAVHFWHFTKLIGLWPIRDLPLTTTHFFRSFDLAWSNCIQLLGNSWKTSLFTVLFFNMWVVIPKGPKTWFVGSCQPFNLSVQERAWIQSHNLLQYIISSMYSFFVRCLEPLGWVYWVLRGSVVGHQSHSFFFLTHWDYGTKKLKSDPLLK